MQDFEKEVKGDPYRRNRMFSQSGKLSGDLQKAGYGLPEKFHFCPPFEIRDYALKSAGGLSEAKTSYPLLISVLSIVPDFVVLAVTEPGAEATPPTHALNTSSIYCFGVFVRFIQPRTPRKIQISHLYDPLLIFVLECGLVFIGYH